MTKLIIIFYFVFLARYNLAQDWDEDNLTGAVVDSSCGDWKSFEEEKCLKIFKHPATYEDALAFCKTQSATIAMVMNRDEQDAIENLLRESDIANNVWIGITKSNGTFKNLDKTGLQFTNWAQNHPVLNKTGFDCVELSLDDESYGQWLEQKCLKANDIICEKTPNMTLKSLQNIVIDLKRKFLDKLSRLEANPVPIGFIYVQLFNQSEPKELWPDTEWKNISANYSSLFFRTEGPEAAPFGKIQEQQTQSIEVKSDVCPNGSCDKNINKLIGTEFFDKQIWTGNANKGDYLSLTFKHNNEEVRPKNSAVRIWQRVK